MPVFRPLFKDMASLSHAIDYVIVMRSFPNPEWHQNCISGSEVKIILLKGLILPIGEVALGKSAPAACAARLLFFLTQQ